MPHDLCRDHPGLASSDRAVGPDCRRAQPILAAEHWLPPAVTGRMQHVYGGTADQPNELGNLSGARSCRPRPDRSWPPTSEVVRRLRNVPEQCGPQLGGTAVWLAVIVSGEADLVSRST